jgi:Ni/Fe-hydrogenase subunit HybB-like protein
LEIARFIPYVGGFWLVIRFISLITSGGITALFDSGFHTAMFLAEIALIGYAVLAFTKPVGPQKAFYTAMILCIGGGVYRFNVYIIGYDPGVSWNAYFPTLPEYMITLGIIAFEILAYIVLARLLKLLPKSHARVAH